MLHAPLLHWGTSFANKFDLSGFKNVLDLGCRQGHITSILAKKYPLQQFYAIDNQPDAIEQALDISEPNVHFAMQDALTLSLENQFDAIVSFNCLLWIKDKRTALKNIFNALQPGGKAFIQLFAIHGRPKNDRFLYQTAQSLHWKSYFKGFVADYYEITLGELYILLQGLGFIIHRMEFVQYECRFAHQEMMQNWMSSWASHKKMLPSSKSDHFMKQAVDSYLKFHNLSQQEAFPYYEYLLEVTCEKPTYNPSKHEKPYQFEHLLFTPKEAFVLKHYLQGKSAKEIAELSAISAKTVEFHLSRIKDKLQCSRRSDIYQTAIRYGFINLIFDT
jgi:trans-aconitate methyltransferase/DNA-binding CsgD family transcriptional regulator